MKKIAGMALIIALCASPLLAQNRPFERAAGFPAAGALKEYLGLSDQQVSDLAAVNKLALEAAKPYMDQIATLRRSMKDAADKAAVQAQIQALHTDIQGVCATYRVQAQAKLTPAQKTALGALEAALQLQAAAHEAARFNLIDGPGRFGPGGRGGMMRRGPGFGGMGMPPAGAPMRSRP